MSEVQAQLSKLNKIVGFALAAGSGMHKIAAELPLQLQAVFSAKFDGFVR